MGYGEFGTNGSMHWNVSHDSDASVPTIRGIDPEDKVGRSTGGQRVLDVRLRFASIEEARKKFDEALEGCGRMRHAQGIYVTVEVPVVPRRSAQSNANWEIRVDW
jgi:hypothetical protein